ncbi:MAG: hypothetical protein AAF485_25530 [Chloroflexota bacterium]
MTVRYPDIPLPHQQAEAEIEEKAPRQTDTTLPAQTLWQRIWRHPSFMHYNRLIALVVAINIAFLYFGATTGQWWTANAIDLATLSNLVVANITLAIIIRQQYVINFLFWLATRAPTSWPLPIRWTLGKVYHFGGLHVGGSVVGTIWFAIFVGSLTYYWANNLPGVSLAVIISTYALLALLVFIIVMALPPLRAKYHDHFELSHRFGGWAALILFWIQTILFVNDQRSAMTLMEALLTTPGFWLLILVTASIVLPWLRLRKVTVDIERPSSHVALVRFNHGVTPMAGSSTTVSRNPLIEWHSFANVPSPGEDGFRLTISRAGDWTGSFIDDAPEKVWVKGIPTAGVANIEVLFKKVIYVATGSGIGPCLPHLLAQEVPARLIWSTRNARETYGDDLVDEIMAVQPDAVIWDTNEHGRPDLVQLAYEAYKDFDAEAVICISNKKLTWQVVYGMESRGIPAYGAIWDS